MMKEEKNEGYESIFRFIRLYENNNFSSMNDIDLKDLLYNIIKCDLSLRPDLGFNKSVTFGLELEFEKSNFSKIVENLKCENLYSEWIIKGDSSLKDGNEINSPILIDTKKTWETLNKVCSIVKKDAVIGENSSSHIHLGTQVLGDRIESWLNFIKLWSVYENIIYRFTYGKRLIHRAAI